VNAGHEATVNTLGNGVRGLLRHPEEWQRLVSGEVTAAAAIDELIRWDPPLQLFERWVLEEGVEIAGVPIPRGEVVSMLFGAANRDPRVFDDADRSTSAARTPPTTSASAAASTPASAPRSPASSSRRRCGASWSERPAFSSPRSPSA
jgi:cytochrome P450